MKFKQAFKIFVRNLTAWAWQHEIDCTAGIVQIAAIHSEGSKAQIDLEFSPEMEEYLVKCLAGMLVGCENYREAKLVLLDGSGQEIIVTIMKGNGKTPHQKRQEAEAEVERQKQRIKELEADLAKKMDDHSRRIDNILAKSDQIFAASDEMFKASDNLFKAADELFKG